jgi:hypothetical protein
LIEFSSTVARQPGTHHQHLRERPGVIQQLVAAGALLGVRQEHDVGFAGVELAHALFANTEPDLHRHPRLARQRANQLDVEAGRPAVLVEILVGRELLIAAVHERSRRLLRQGGFGQREDKSGKQDQAAHGRILQGSGMADRRSGRPIGRRPAPSCRP